MADNLNTPYLGQGTTSDNLNTRYIADSGSTEVEPNPREFSSAISFTGAVALDGAVVSSDSFSNSGGAAFTGDIDASAATVLMRGKTDSATSATVEDTQLSIMESDNTNVTLIYRSGNTTYHWVSSAGSVG